MSFTSSLRSSSVIVTLILNKCNNNMDIFCKIINNEIPSYTIYEDEIVKVFLDVNPNHIGHTLIVPKKHYQDFFDIDEEALHHILKVAKEIAVLLKERLNYDGISLCENNGLGQEVKHYHVHLIPRYEDDNWNINFNQESLKDTDEVYQEIMK